LPGVTKGALAAAEFTKDGQQVADEVFCQAKQEHHMMILSWRGSAWFSTRLVFGCNT